MQSPQVQSVHAVQQASLSVGIELLAIRVITETGCNAVAYTACKHSYSPIWSVYSISSTTEACIFATNLTMIAELQKS